MHYGGDYNPEQWPEEIWPEDVERMREAGVTLVSLGIFAWARIQRVEGEFDFEWLDRVIALLHEGGIAVDLATATASPPPWMHETYPEILPRDANGVVMGPGSRQHYAPSSPVYRRFAAELVTAIVHRYAAHPAVVMWHVNNEYGCNNDLDYSDTAAVAFRRWLRDRYGSIEALGEAWGTMFWSQRYTSFDQVLPPRTVPATPNPGQLLDFRRFSSDMLLECYVMERDIIRAAGATQPVTTNFMGAFKGVDYWRWAREVDFVSDDNYADPNDPESFRPAAFARDLMRSLKPGVPWVLMEQSTNAVNWRPSNAPKAPGQMAALSMQAVGRGADGIMFFQWRQSKVGSEKFHSAMLPHAGTDTRTWREVVAFGAELKQLPDLPAGSVGGGDGDARVAIVFDWQNWWAIENPGHPVRLSYLEIVQRWYSAFHAAHVQVDIVAAGAALDGYRVVVAPSLYLLDDAAASVLVRFVEGGGRLLVTAFSDVVDESDQFLPGGFLTRLGGVLGVTVEEFGALVAIDDPPATPGQRTAGVRLADGTSFAGSVFAEAVRVIDAETLGVFEGGRTDGLPAVTVRRHPSGGEGYYIATVPDADGARAVVDRVLEATGIAPVLHGLPDRVEVAQRADIVTLINHGTEPVTISVAGAGLAGLDDPSPVEVVELAPYGYRLLRLTG